jgi:hypothetical protein
MRTRAIATTSDENRPGGTGAQQVILRLKDGSELTLTLNGCTEVRLFEPAEVETMTPHRGQLRGQLLSFPAEEPVTYYQSFGGLLQAATAAHTAGRKLDYFLNGSQGSPVPCTGYRDVANNAVHCVRAHLNAGALALLLKAMGRPDIAAIMLPKPPRSVWERLRKPEL